MKIAETEFIDDAGWNKREIIEDTKQCAERAKDLIREFKDYFRENRETVKGKTFIGITHGAFLNTLACVFTNNLDNASLDFFIPENNSVTILDFDDVK